MQLIEQLKRILSYRTTSIIVILLSVAGRMAQKLVFTGLDDDKCFQIQATKNLLAGHGISTYEVFAENLSLAHYTPLIKWPPGYTFLLSPFHAISGNDFLWGTVWLDLIACFFFVWLARKIIHELDAPIWLINLYTLVAGFFFYDFISTNSSDLLALVFLQAAVLFTLRYFKSGGKNPVHIIWIIFCLFLPALLRYMYVPVVLIIPAYIILHGIITRNKIFTRRGALIFITLVACLGGLLLFQKLTGGSAAYVTPAEKGFHPDNLLQMTPFLYASSGILGMPIVVLQKLTGAGANMLNLVIWSHLGLLVVFVLISLKHFIKKKFFAVRVGDHFVNISIFSSLAVVGTLCVLSVYFSKLYLINGLVWTYVTEPRYYAVPVFFLQLLLILFLYRRYNEKPLRRVLTILAMVPLIVSTLHGIYFTVKKTVGMSNNFLKRSELVALEPCRELFHTFVQNNPNKEIICASGDYMFNNFASIWENVPGLYDYQILNSLAWKTQKPTIIFVPVKNWYAHTLKNFLDNPAKKYIGRVNEWTFYSIEIGPNSK